MLSQIVSGLRLGRGTARGWIVAACAILPVTGAWADSGSMTDIGYLPGGTAAYSTNISGDGSTLVGYAYTATEVHAMRWSQGGGMEDLGTLVNGTSSQANAASSNGRVVVGYSTTTGGNTHAFRWVQGSGMQDLGVFLGGHYSYANAVSGDGSAVAGYSDLTSQDHAFRWTQGGGLQDLGTLVPGSYSSANGISTDGNVVVGSAGVAGGLPHAFRWTQGGGMQDLGTLLGGSISVGVNVSGDGATVVGNADTSSGEFHATRWTSGGGMEDLGVLSGGNDSVSSAASNDGSVIVGHSNMTGGAYHATRWTQTTGLADLNTLLTNAGVNMGGIVLSSANGVSSDGQYIAANAGNESYIVSYSAASSGGGGGGAGITTFGDQQLATEQLLRNQLAMLVNSRATGNALLGMARPINEQNYMSGGGMVGSGAGYSSGQFSRNHLTLLGGLSYGYQDYANIEQSNSITVAGAARYMLGETGNTLRPFFELGGWVTPQENLTMSRVYANGAGTATGSGTGSAYGWAGYGRAGLQWQAAPKSSIAGYAELGEQVLNYDGYTEALSSSNPFPATVNDGSVRSHVARFGGSATQQFAMLPVPVSLTLSGAVAHAFDTHANLSVDVAGVGLTQAGATETTWGEMGAQLGAHLTSQLDVNAGMIGFTGNGAQGTNLHGTFEVGYKF